MDGIGAIEYFNMAVELSNNLNSLLRWFRNEIKGQPLLHFYTADLLEFLGE